MRFKMKMLNNLRVFLIFGIFIVGFVFIISSQGLTESERSEDVIKLNKIRIGYPIDNFNWFTVFVAKELGFFQREGLDVELKKVPANGMVAAFSGGDIDYATHLLLGTKLALKGHSFRVIAVTFYGIFVLVVSNDIDSVSKLKNKKIAVTTRLSRGYLHTLFLKEKYGLKDIKISFMNNELGMVAMLKSGQVDGIITSFDTASVLKKEGYRVLIKLWEEWKIPQSGIITETDKVKNKPDEVKKVVRAVLNAISYIKNEAHKKEIIKIISQFTLINDKETLGEIYDVLIKSESLDGDGYPEPEDFINIIKQAKMKQMADFKEIKSIQIDQNDILKVAGSWQFVFPQKADD